MSRSNLRGGSFRLPLFVVGLLCAVAAYASRSMGEVEPKNGPPKSEVKPIFEDKLDGELPKGWTVLREELKAWRIGKNGLELRATDAQHRNLVLTPTFKGGSELIAEVFVELHASVQFEHAGLLCFFDEKNAVEVVREGVGGVTLTHRKNNKLKWQTADPKQEALWVRVVVSQGKATGFYKVKAEDEWKKVGDCDLPADGDFRFALSCGSWPKAADDWGRFRDFRILPLTK